ncbi:hypothetical protein ACFQZU_06860, partial [Streptomonospora algeriensis]
MQRYSDFLHRSAGVPIPGGLPAGIRVPPQHPRPQPYLEAVPCPPTAMAATPRRAAPADPPTATADG